MKHHLRGTAISEELPPQHSALQQNMILAKNHLQPHSLSHSHIQTFSRTFSSSQQKRRCVPSKISCLNRPNPSSSQKLLGSHRKPQPLSNLHPGTQMINPCTSFPWSRITVARLLVALRLIV